MPIPPRAQPPSLLRITRAYRNVERITELMKVMVKFGFGDLFIAIGLGDLLLRVKRLAGLGKDSLGPLPRPKRLRLALEEMGLVFVKLGQYLSTRQDILPQEYIQEFALLQDNVQPIPFSEIKKIIAASLEENALLDVEETPLASASVGQVHAAKLPGGQEVVVKVRRPGLTRQAVTDLEILWEIATQIDKFLPSLSFLRPLEIVAEFKRSLLAELNYRLEATNALRFGRLYARSAEVKIPKLYRSLTTENTLVMERIRGTRFDDAAGLQKAGISPVALARLTSKICLEQFMSLGFFHGDPHPGNLYAQPGPKVAFMDFGLIGQIDPKSRDELLKLALGVIRHNPSAMARSVLSLTIHDGKVDRDSLETELTALLDNHLSGTLKEINLLYFIQDIIELMTQRQLRPPSDLLLLAKALIQFEHLGLVLNSDFNLLEDAGPIIANLYRRRFDPRFWVERLFRRGEDFLYAVQSLPQDLAPMVANLKRGRLQVDFELTNLNAMRHSVREASQRLSFALLLGSLLIGSALVIHAHQPPFWRGVPALGAIGLILAFLLGIWFFIDFIRGKKF
ncbi:MAG: hypothetical protein LBO66_11450 [Deltaproteobacteria bacterium]|nr:hypothetical protein [Deltaproteobacteria bacterium]